MSHDSHVPSTDFTLIHNAKNKEYKSKKYYSAKTQNVYRNSKSDETAAAAAKIVSGVCYVVRGVPATMLEAVVWSPEREMATTVRK